MSDGFSAVGGSMKTARIWLYLQRVEVGDSTPIGQGQFLALALLCDTAAALIRGAMTLIETRNLYGASALTRQLVEVEYLAWAFGNDPDEIVSWYKSSKDERLARWQPRHLRKRSGGKFRGSDYAEHCETGGHPTPDGMTNLIHGEQEPIVEILAHELAVHGSSTWDYTIQAIVLICLQLVVERRRSCPMVPRKQWGWQRSVGRRQSISGRPGRLTKRRQGKGPSLELRAFAEPVGRAKHVFR